jgi:hypothetical protein
MTQVQANVRRHATKLVVVAVLALATLGLGLSLPAGGNTQITGITTAWVSGVGDDANPCSRTAPCKTFNGAKSKVDMPSGVIKALDPGSYGPFTILGQVEVDGGSDLAVINATSGFAGILIDADPGEVVTLRNLVIRGTLGGTTGINFAAGSGLILEHVTIEGFTADALRVTSPGAFVHMSDVTFRRNGDNGLSASGAPGPVTTVTIVDSRFEANVNAGVLAGDHTEVTVEGSALTGNGQALACVPVADGSCTLTATDNLIAQNTKGVVAGRGLVEATGSARVWISSNTISENDSGLSITAFANGRITSLGDNVVVHNTLNGRPTTTITTT